MICPNCNKLIANEAKECPNCGFDLSQRHSSFEEAEDTAEQEPYKRKKDYKPLIRIAIAGVLLVIIIIVAHHFIKPISMPEPVVTEEETEVITTKPATTVRAVSGDTLKGKIEGKTFVLLGDPGDFGLYQEISFKKGKATLFVSNEAEDNKYTKKYTVSGDEITVDFDTKYDAYNLTFMADDTDELIKYHSVTASKMSDWKADYFSFIVPKKEYKKNGSKKLAKELDGKTVQSEFFAKAVGADKNKARLTFVGTVDGDSIFSSLVFEAPGVKTDNVGKTVNDNLAVFKLGKSEYDDKGYSIFLFRQNGGFKAVITEDDKIVATEMWEL